MMLLIYVKDHHFPVDGVPSGGLRMKRRVATDIINEAVTTMPIYVQSCRTVNTSDDKNEIAIEKHRMITRSHETFSADVGGICGIGGYMAKSGSRRYSNSSGNDSVVIKTKSELEEENKENGTAKDEDTDNESEKDLAPAFDDFDFGADHVLVESNDAFENLAQMKSIQNES